MVNFIDLCKNMKNNEIKKLLINFKSNPDKALYISVIFQAVLDASKDNF